MIMSDRQKTDSNTNIPLLPKAIEIMEKYKDHPICLERNSVLPVKSNQKMNEYLKEIATLCEFDTDLNTHKARRTFGSTVTLGNGVPIHVVKEMLGHHSVKQTEEYALTEQESISFEMNQLKEKLNANPQDKLSKIEFELQQIRENYFQSDENENSEKLNLLELELNKFKILLSK